jgi:hypothetical protein
LGLPVVAAAIRADVRMSKQTNQELLYNFAAAAALIALILIGAAIVTLVI